MFNNLRQSTELCNVILLSINFFLIVNAINFQEILGHTEDALSEVLNHFYIVSAHIISDSPQGKYNVTEEKFTSLCYAGHLPGYTMNYNHHGLVFSINTLSANNLNSGKTRKCCIVLIVDAIYFTSTFYSTSFYHQGFIKCGKFCTGSNYIARQRMWSW